MELKKKCKGVIINYKVMAIYYCLFYLHIKMVRILIAKSCRDYIAVIKGKDLSALWLCVGRKLP